ncbi:MAG: hypothetical protein HY645_00240 [Acidobacteria bacterium]|nr:hypothetical protein [Acidobacteriota bacterium]
MGKGQVPHPDTSEQLALCDVVGWARWQPRPLQRARLQWHPCQGDGMQDAVGQEATAETGALGEPDKLQWCNVLELVCELGNRERPRTGN